MPYGMVMAEAARWSFIAAMGCLAVHDIATFRIPNWGNLLVAALFVAFAPFTVPATAWLQHLGAAGLVLAAGIVMFYARALGGGDVKLLAAGALWIGFPALLEYVIWVGLVGGALAVALLVLRRNLVPLVAMVAPRVPETWPRILVPGENIPYGVAIAAAAILVALRNPTFLA
jgi:prepilin peptidase CpaA